MVIGLFYPFLIKKNLITFIETIDFKGKLAKISNGYLIL